MRIRKGGWFRMCSLLIAVCIVLATSGYVSAAYYPNDDIRINCGSSLNATVDGFGLFVSDQSASYVSEGILATSAVQTNDDPYPSLLESARLFPGSATYKIPVTPGRHWVRLWFYPFSYQTYDPANSLFSVFAGGYTLITNLSVSGETSNAKSKYIFKEYCLNVTTSTLFISFQPVGTNSYAFINGLEVISVPDDLFIDTARLVSNGADVSFGLSTIAFELMYRINVGGQVVLPDNDSYLSRSWDPDSKYVFGAALGVIPPTVPSDKINYPPAVPEYFAPGSVYGTGREMGATNVVNANFNITWTFAVDPGFEYFLRLHFCETVYTAANERVFNIYINNASGYLNFDIIGITVDPDTAAYFDFLAPMFEGPDVLFVQIGPSAQGTSLNKEALLNGLEIFKINSTNGSLAGSAYVAPPKSHTSTSGSKKNNMGLIIGAVVGGLAAVGVVIAFLFFFCSHKGKVSKHPSPAWLPLPLHGNSESTASKISTTTSHKSGTGSYVSSAASNLGRFFTFAELQEATNNFDEELLLGVGGFGKVYKGEVDDGTKVAVKRGNPRSEQGLTEFQTEIELLSKLRHRHLVSLIGYCEEHCEMILVYDYMANGPLRGHLYGTDLQPLSWKQRLEICIGAARGLHYLHTGAAQGIIHRDVKTTNILLDENFVAKVADFGLSKTGPTLDRTHVSTAVKGSFGYLDPEYFRRQQLTEKSDVYSFGVVLMEVVCARPAINPALPREQVNIAEWAMQWQKMGMLEQIIDPKLVGYCNAESLRKFGETAEKCLAEQGIDRPAIGDVLWNLEYALQLQENSMENRLMEGSTNRILELPLRAPDADDSDLTATQHSLESEEDSEDATASAVFSQLVNPQGR